MCRADTMRRQRNRAYFKWIQSSLERKKHLFCRRLFTASKNTSHQENYALVVQQLQRNPTKKRGQSCLCSPSIVMFCLLKNIALIFLTLLKLPNETNRTNISFLFTWLTKCSYATGEVSNTACGFYYLHSDHSLKVLYLKLCDSIKVERSSL